MKGMTGNHSLFVHLLDSIHNKGIFTLHQMYDVHNISLVLHGWKTTEVMGLEGVYVAEWESYLQLLRQAGISINTNIDCMVWDGTLKNEQLAGKEIYRRMPVAGKEINQNMWFQDTWKGDLPNKLKCFSWLVLNDHVLTWKNLHCRGHASPEICILCHREPKDVDHLFLSCSYAKLVWDGVLRSYKLLIDLSIVSIFESLYFLLV